MLTKRQKKVWNIIRIILGLVFVYFIIIRPLRMLFIGLEGMAQQMPDTKNILPEYRNLLDSLSNAQLVVNHTYNSRRRSSVSVGTYKNQCIFIFVKVSSSYPYSLRGTISLKKGQANFSSMIDYVSVVYGNVESLIDFNFAENKKPDAKKVYLTVDGDSTVTVIKNDSLALFYVHFKKMSVKYNVDSINDIVISAKEDELKNGDEVPMDLAFIKKHNSLYLIVMSPIHEEQQLSPDDLLKMLKK